MRHKEAWKSIKIIMMLLIMSLHMHGMHLSSLKMRRGNIRWRRTRTHLRMKWGCLKWHFCLCNRRTKWHQAWWQHALFSYLLLLFSFFILEINEVVISQVSSACLVEMLCNESFIIFNELKEFLRRENVMRELACLASFATTSGMKEFAWKVLEIMRVRACCALCASPSQEKLACFTRNKRFGICGSLGATDFLALILGLEILSTMSIWSRIGVG